MDPAAFCGHFCYAESYQSTAVQREGRKPLRAGRCPKCRGNLYFEMDIPEGLLMRKCLQCGLIESYFWLERTTRTLVHLPVEHDQPVAADSW